MASWYEFGATVTLSLTADSGADVAIRVVAPDGTASTPTPTFSGSQWSASVTASQYDEWTYAWTVDGVLTSQGVFTVGGPWYATVAQLRAEMTVPSSTTDRDAGFARALKAASRAVEEWCDNRPVGGFLLADTASVRKFRRDRWTLCTDQGFQLPVDDIGSLTDLVVETSDDGTTWTTLTIDTDFEVWPENALAYSRPITALLSASDWPARVRVTAKWGWPEVPSQVAEATLRQAARLYKRKDSPQGLADGGELGQVRVPNLDPDVQRLLSFLHTEAMVG